MLKYNALVELRKKFKKVEQEIDELKLKLENFQTSSKNISKLLASQITNKTGLGHDNQVFNSIVFDCNELISSESDVSMPTSLVHDRYKSKDEYHVIHPPYTGTFMPPKPDLVFYDAPTATETVPTVLNVMHSTTMPKKDMSQSNRPSDLIIKDWVCDSEDEPEGLAAVSGTSRDLIKTAVGTTCLWGWGRGNPHHALKDKEVIDNGFSRHMTGNISYLFDFKEINGGYVAFGGNPKGGKIAGKGKIRIGKLDFDDVYFVKELKLNLFSVSQMCDKKNSVLFKDTECIILSSDFKLSGENHMLLRVLGENNMYNVDLKNIVPLGDLTCLFAKATLDESNNWHRRIGYINFKTMNKLVKGNLVRGLPSKVFENNPTCVASKKGKQHRASCKSKHVSSVNQPLQRLHMDLFGPTFIKSLNKKSYCLVVTDDYSRFSWVFFLVTKDETSPILKTFITGIENQINHKVKIIRSDNGTEFKNHDLKQFCGMKGIKREFSVARTSQQNEIAKRKNRTLIEEARTMLADSLLPIPFWAEDKGKTPVEFSTRVIDLSDEFEEFFDNKTNMVNAASTLVTAVGLNSTNSTNTFSVVGPSNNAVSLNFELGGKSSFVDPSQYLDDPDMPALENITYSDDEEDVEKPKRIHQAHKDPSWIEAMQKEFLQFKIQKFWVLGYLPKGKRAIGSKREEGIDYKEVFPPVARIEAICLFLAYSSFMGFMVYQMDIKSVFLYRTIEEEVYVCQPLGFEDLDYPDKVYKVVKALYGLHQAPRAWYETLANYLLENSFQRGKIDQTLFIKKKKDRKSASTPTDTEKPLLKDPNGKDVDVHIYRSMIGSLMYLTSSRPDIMFAVYACAHFQVTPKASHLHAVKKIFRYLKDKPHLGLWYLKDSPFNLVAYSDSDYTGASLDRKSTIRGYGKSTSTFIDTKKDPNGEDVYVHTYRSMIGSLMYLTSSRPDIMFEVCVRVNTPRCDEDRLKLMELTVFLLPSDKKIRVEVSAVDLQVNDVTRLQALVDKKKVVIKEASIRDALRLDDVEGVECLLNEDIFTKLARMGY
nr:putative ribonuclease H-like domain-containing protein [Tanacetum cinerariifolium]